jgi:hypothetical protein
VALYVGSNVAGVDPAFLTTPPPPPPLPTSVNASTACGTLTAGQGLLVGQTIHSCDGRFGLGLQGDGNLVLRMGATPLWATATDGHVTFKLVMRGSGDLELFDDGNNIIWSSGTANHTNGVARLQNDGNLVLFDTNNVPYWASNTGGH